MDPRKLFADSRCVGVCVYCGAEPDTDDHVPSKILLDDPLPPNLPTVSACSTCNRSFSLDEEYLACFLECVLAGSSDPARLRREKVKRALSRNPRLVERIRSSCRVDDNGTLVWAPEASRVRNMIVKLARGHAAYELSLPLLDDPEEVTFLPFATMVAADRAVFENARSGEVRIWPEIGSRAFLHACGAKPYSDEAGPWIVVQPDRYRYSVDQHEGVRVQIVLAEYLACVVDWA